MPWTCGHRAGSCELLAEGCLGQPHYLLLPSPQDTCCGIFTTFVGKVSQCSTDNLAESPGVMTFSARVGGGERGSLMEVFRQTQYCSVEEESVQLLGLGIVSS